VADHPRLSSTAHPDHDTILVAALAAGDLADLALADAEALVAACPECARLRADLLAIAAATKALPAPVRSRDFRLTPAQAERLRPSGPRRWLAAFASPRLAVTRPLAVAFTTLGIAGLLLTAIPAAGPLGVFSGAAQREAAGGASDENIQIEGVDDPIPAPASSGGWSATDDGSALGPRASDADDANDPARDREVSAAESADEPVQRPWLLVLSLAMLSAGVGLFAARRLGRPD
jgi:hypothetical protein